MREKKMLETENIILSPRKNQTSKMSKEALNYISELEMELDRAKTEILEVNLKNEKISEKLYSKYPYLNPKEMNENPSLHEKLYTVTSRLHETNKYRRKRFLKGKTYRFTK